VSLRGAAVAYRAAPGEVNRVTVTPRTGAVTVRDAGAPVNGCTAIGPNEARCDGAFCFVSLALGDSTRGRKYGRVY
jgi:hypothetical protein